MTDNDNRIQKKVEIEISETRLSYRQLLVQNEVELEALKVNLSKIKKEFRKNKNSKIKKEILNTTEKINEIKLKNRFFIKKNKNSWSFC